MNFCKDCKHAVGDLAQPYALTCGHPKNGVDFTHNNRYAVSGIPEPVVQAILASSCLAMRNHEKHPTLKIELCGPDGVWFERKDV